VVSVSGVVIVHGGDCILICRIASPSMDQMGALGPLGGRSGSDEWVGMLIATRAIDFFEKRCTGSEVL